jgi:flagellar biosynthesis/type III secretory pathway protein FliH
MASRAFVRRALAAGTCVTLTLGPVAAYAAQRDSSPDARAVSRDVPANTGSVAQPRATQDLRTAQDNGFREGLRQGETDARDRRAAKFERDEIYRAADRGYERRFGDPEAYRLEFRRGFAAGYRQGYDGVVGLQQGRGNAGREVWRDDDRYRRWTRGYQEPATARGYSDGYEQGRDDGRDRDRYDPVRHKDYRSGDNGYFRDYGSKDAYKNNYRTGFRQGYEDGYRDGNGGRR